MSRYHDNKCAAQTRQISPTLTDQSQARDTDINVIVGRFLKTGTAPGARGTPQSGDFSEMPEDLRAMIEKSRELTRYRNQLPQQLRGMPINELLALTPERIQAILQPPEQPDNTGKQSEQTLRNQGPPT